MTWIKTISMQAADQQLIDAIAAQHELYPVEYEQPTDPNAKREDGIVGSHSLIPTALRHAFATFGALMAPDLPLSRSQHEMISTVVSVTNRCRY